MILFHSESDFVLKNKSQHKKWLKNCISSLKMEVGSINYIFCEDDYLLKINEKYLNHDTLTDIISFDYTENNRLSGDIYISVERVKENASSLSIAFDDELSRVLIHGILHFVGFKDKSQAEKSVMREQENYYLSLRAF